MFVLCGHLALFYVCSYTLVRYTHVFRYLTVVPVLSDYEFPLAALQNLII